MCFTIKGRRKVFKRSYMAKDRALIVRILEACKSHHSAPLVRFRAVSDLKFNSPWQEINELTTNASRLNCIGIVRCYSYAVGEGRREHTLICPGIDKCKDQSRGRPAVYAK